MYGKIDPEKIAAVDLSFFAGSFLTQICFGVADISLHFDRPSVSVVTQANFLYSLNGQLQTCSVEMGHLLRPFLNRDVVSAKWGEMGTMIISFDGEDDIRLIDESERFESFTITHAGTTIIV